MKHYEGRELDEKIEAFLSRKLAKYPEFESKRAIYYAVAYEPDLSTRLKMSLPWFRPFAAH